MSKKLISYVILFMLMTLSINSAYAEPIKIINPIEVSGKILDKDGNPFTEQVEVDIDLISGTVDFASGAQTDESKIYKIPTQAGTFSWKGEGTELDVEVVKEGYHSTSVMIFTEGLNQPIKQDGILIYLIPKGTPSKLEFTRGAEINEKDNKPCGWSFTKRWYFPVGEEESVGMVQSFTEDGKVVYTMKAPGGFVLFPGFPQFESKLDRHEADFKLMPEAPKEGYIQSITPAFDNRDKVRTGHGVYYYFRTPNGKYGKIRFSGDFDYYLQPDGSRNLEAGEIVKKYPVNPIEANRHKGY